MHKAQTRTGLLVCNQNRKRFNRFHFLKQSANQLPTNLIHSDANAEHSGFVFQLIQASPVPTGYPRNLRWDSKALSPRRFGFKFLEKTAPDQESEPISRSNGKELPHWQKIGHRHSRGIGGIGGSMPRQIPRSILGGSRTHNLRLRRPAASIN